MQEVVCEIFLDDIAFVTTANNELVHAMRGIYFHNMPQDGLATDFNHRFWP